MRHTVSIVLVLMLVLYHVSGTFVGLKGSKGVRMLEVGAAEGLLDMLGHTEEAEREELASLVFQMMLKVKAILEIVGHDGLRYLKFGAYYYMHAQIIYCPVALLTS
jgi:hypothetical protein